MTNLAQSGIRDVCSLVILPAVASWPQQREAGNQPGGQQRPPMHSDALTPEHVTLRLALDPLFAPIHVARTACSQRDSSLFARLEHAESGEPRRHKHPEPCPARSVISDQHKPQESCRDSRHETQDLAFTNFSIADVCESHDTHLTTRRRIRLLAFSPRTTAPLSDRKGTAIIAHPFVGAAASAVCGCKALAPGRLDGRREQLLL